MERVQLAAAVVAEPAVESVVPAGTEAPRHSPAAPGADEGPARAARARPDVRDDQQRDAAGRSRPVAAPAAVAVPSHLREPLWNPLPGEGGIVITSRAGDLGQTMERFRHGQRLGAQGHRLRALLQSTGGILGNFRGRIPPRSFPWFR